MFGSGTKLVGRIRLFPSVRYSILPGAVWCGAVHTFSHALNPQTSWIWNSRQNLIMDKVLKAFLMVGHRLWSWRGIALRQYLLLRVSLRDQSLDYLNDLPDKIKSQVRLFADDTAAYLAITKLQDDLYTLQEWETDWDMEFNPGKSQVIHVTRSRLPIPTSYILHGQTL